MVIQGSTFGLHPRDLHLLHHRTKNPLTKLLMDVSESQESLLEDHLLLTNRINLHRCSDYCLRAASSRNKSIKECRMEFGNEDSPGKDLSLSSNR